MKKKVDTITIINKAFICGKFLSPQIKDMVYQRLEELSKGNNPEVWNAYKRGIELGVEHARHERELKLNRIKGWWDELSRTR